LGQSGGTHALTGFYLPLGSAGSAPTGTVTATTLGTNTGSFLKSSNSYTASPYWTESGATAKTYDTGFNPTATGHIMVQQVDHTWGDAGSSVKVPAAASTNNYFSYHDMWNDHGQGVWTWSFFQLASSGLVNNQYCDVLDMKGGVTTQELTAQVQYHTATGMRWVLEETDATANSVSADYGSLMDTPIRVGFKVAGVNERYHQLQIWTKSGSTWSQSGSTLQLDVLCSNGATGTCANPPAPVASPTGTASSGSFTLTVSSGTGIIVGQVVTGTGIADPSQTGHPAWTVVENVSGTTVTLSQYTISAISGTTVNFYAPPHELVAASDCSVTAGSTAMSCTLPLVGTVVAGQSIGGKGIVGGTRVGAVSGTGPISVTLTVPASSTMSTGDGATFWSPATNQNTTTFGKQASCTVSADQWWSDLAVDYTGSGILNNPN